MIKKITAFEIDSGVDLSKPETWRECTVSEVDTKDVKPSAVLEISDNFIATEVDGVIRFTPKEELQ